MPELHIGRPHLQNGAGMLLCERMLEAMDRAGWTRLPVAGGSPGTRGELERLRADRLDLRFVTEDTTPNRKTVAPLLARPDVATVWTSTES